MPGGCRSAASAANAGALSLRCRRDWSGLFVHDSLGRVAEAVDRCLDLQSELVVANLLVAGEEPARQAA
jgi:hypothetical protein